jgi:hypothetical protein
MKKDQQSGRIQDEITRKKALKKIGEYGKYAALTALGTYILLSPRAAQANSVAGMPPPPPDHFDF